jgi:hypothetical protein
VPVPEDRILLYPFAPIERAFTRIQSSLRNVMCLSKKESDLIMSKTVIKKRRRKKREAIPVTGRASL